MDREDNKKRQEELLELLPEVEAELREKTPGLLGVGIGLKEKNGKFTDEIVYRVYVSEKKPKEELEQSEIIPDSVRGINTDVTEFEENTPHADTSKYRPIEGGIQIGNDKQKHIGTLGCMATLTSTGETVMLSNHHVMYADGAGVGAKIGQPRYKHCCCCSCDVVGSILNGSLGGLVDCAIASTSVSSCNTILGGTKVKGSNQAIVGEQVTKVGRTTGKTTGTVIDINYITSSTTGTQFTHQVLIHPTSADTKFSDGGDSGSAIFNSDDEVVALLWGGGGDGTPSKPYRTVGNNIDDVLNAMGITINVYSDDVPVNEPGIFFEEDESLLDKYIAILNKSANGRAVVEVIKRHQDEVLHLVNTNRPTMVCWQRNEGPSFLQAYNDLGTHPDKEIPKEINGVTLEEMLTNMAEVLKENGSEGLKQDIETYQPMVTAYLPGLSTLNNILEQINTNPVSCSVMDSIWQLLWTSGTVFYLPTVFENGLDIPLIGVDIPPLKQVNIGDLPKITMFKEPVLGYMEMELTDTVLTGLPTVKEGSYSCKSGTDDTTNIAFTLSFDKLNYSGKYSVSAGGGIAGCAIAGAAHILGGGGDLTELVASTIDGNINEALWYREPLSGSDAGQKMLGAYYLNNPSINDLVQEPGSILAQSMRQENIQETTDQVNSATTYYYNQQNGLENAEEAAPEIGTTTQYGNGGTVSAYCVIMCNQKIQNGQDPDGKYAKLKNYIIHFTGGIDKYQKEYPGTQPVGGNDGILNRIGVIDMQESHDYVMENGPYPLVHPESGEILEQMMPQPLDFDEMQAAYNLKFGSWSVEDGGNTANGTFSDTGLNVEIDVEMSITKKPDEDVTVDITSLTGSIGDLNIQLSEGSGWWPGLFDKVTNWIANAGFFQDMLKDHINDGLNQDSVKDFLSGVINGALKKL